MLDLSVQSTHFTFSAGDTVYSVAAPQWAPCTWSTPIVPVEVPRQGRPIQLNMDRPPTYHNDINVGLDQTVALSLTGTLWQLDESPLASLQCPSYRSRKQALDAQSSECSASMVRSIAVAQSLSEIPADVRIQLDCGPPDSADGAAGAGVDRGVHAFVLQAQSPVFRRMLAGPMLEATDRTVKMAGVSPGELDDFLTAVYQLGVPRELQEDQDRLLGLLSMADRYEVIALRDACAVLLSRQLTEDNMVAILRVADLHQAEGLRLAALDFITARMERVASAMDSDDQSVRRSVREHLSALATREAAVKPMEVTLTV